jgi:hypothetical protein
MFQPRGVDTILEKFELHTSKIIIEIFNFENVGTFNLENLKSSTLKS